MAKPQALELKPGDRAPLEKIVKKGTVQAREARRARILLLKVKGETASAIAGKAGFELVFTPVHGSWLNLIERLFSKYKAAAVAGASRRLKRGAGRAHLQVVR